MEIGELTLDEWFAGDPGPAPEILGQPINMDAYLTFMAEMPVGVHWPVVHKARELLAAGCPIALLTNNVKEWGDHWRATFPVDELFEVVVDSSEVGMRKPDPRIYLLTCERLGVAPDASVFIDDNAENIAAAARSAWRRCTSARTRSSPSPSSTRSSTAAAPRPPDASLRLRCRMDRRRTSSCRRAGG